MKIAVISVTMQGDAIAETIKKSLPVDIFSKNHSKNFHIGLMIRDCMENYNAIIFISSTGIAVRSIAPYIKRKDIDPALLVIDCTGNFVISLLSGHLGGANALTLKVAAIIGAQPVITTASDNLGFTSPDMIAKENDFEMDDLKKAKSLAALLVEGQAVGFMDEAGQISCPDFYQDASTYDAFNLKGILYITNKENIFLCKGIQGFEKNSERTILKLIRKNIILGIGCKKNYDSTKMLENVYEALRKLNIDKRAIQTVSTIDIKKDEKAIVMLAESLHADLKVWHADEIKPLEGHYLGSDFVEKSIGVRAVCEPSVELCGGILLTGKIVMEGMTICIGEVEGVQL